MSATFGNPRNAAGVGAWAVAVLAVAVVVAVVVLRDPPGRTDAADPTDPPSGAATGTPPPTGEIDPVPNPPLTLEGWGPVRIGGPGSALARVLCEGSWCPEPVVDVAVDSVSGCVQRVRPPVGPDAVTVWIWEVGGRVEAVGVTGPPGVVQETPLGPDLGAVIGDDGSGRPRGGPPGTARVDVLGDIRVTVASLSSEFVEYAEVATPIGAACEAEVPGLEVEPVGADEPVVVDGAVDGVALSTPASDLAAAGWSDVSFGAAPCRTWLSSSGAVAYSRGDRVVGLSARAVEGGPVVGQPLDEVTTSIDGDVVVDETIDEPWASPWGPTYGTAVITGTAGRLSLTTVRPAGVVPDIDWPVRPAAPPTVVSAIVVGESCEEAPLSDHRTAFP